MKPCPFFQHGLCLLGDDCTLAHVKEEEKDPKYHEYEEEEEEKIILEQEQPIAGFLTRPQGDANESSGTHKGPVCPEQPSLKKMVQSHRREREVLYPPTYGVSANYSLTTGRLLPPRPKNNVQEEAAAEQVEDVKLTTRLEPELRSPRKSVHSDPHDSVSIPNTFSSFSEHSAKAPACSHHKTPAAAAAISLAALANQLRAKSNDGARFADINNNNKNVQKLNSPEQTFFTPLTSTLQSTLAEPAPPQKLTTISEEKNINNLFDTDSRPKEVGTKRKQFTGRGHQLRKPEPNSLRGADLHSQGSSSTTLSTNSISPDPSSSSPPSWSDTARSLPLFYSEPSSQSYFPPGAIDRAIVEAGHLMNSTVSVLQTQYTPPFSTPPVEAVAAATNCLSLMPPNTGVGRGAYRKRESPFQELRRPGFVPPRTELNRGEDFVSASDCRRSNHQQQQQVAATIYFCHQCEKELSSLASNRTCPICCGDFTEDITTVEKTSLNRQHGLSPSGDYEYAVSLSRDLEREDKCERAAQKISTASGGEFSQAADYDYACSVSQDFEREEACERARRIRAEVGVGGAASGRSGIEGFAYVPPGNLYQSFLKPEDKLRDWGNSFNPYLYLDEEDEVVSDFPELGPPANPAALVTTVQGSFPQSSSSSSSAFSQNSKREEVAFQSSCFNASSSSSSSNVVNTRRGKEETTTTTTSAAAAAASAAATNAAFEFCSATEIEIISVEERRQ